VRYPFTIILCAAVLGGCAASSSTKVMGGASGLGCHAAGASAVLGSSLDEHVLQEALRGSGALRSRVIAPGSSATTDVDPMRLNIQLDEAGHIRRMVCG
jgi:hypothetical protein